MGFLRYGRWTALDCNRTTRSASYSLTVSGWQESAAGLPPWDAATKVVMPEFDGRIIGPVVGFRKQSENSKTASGTESYTIGLADRIRACVDPATRYSVLRRKPNAEKRLALVLTNFANRHGRNRARHRRI